jgi:hypothetical protein
MLDPKRLPFTIQIPFRSVKASEPLYLLRFSVFLIRQTHAHLTDGNNIETLVPLAF